MKHKRNRQFILVTLLLALLLGTPVLAQQSVAVDLKGPDYTGNVMMSENLKLDIESDDDLPVTQATGIPATPAGSPGLDINAGGAAEGEAAAGGRCLTPYLNQENLPALDQIPRLRNALATAYKVGDTKTFYSDYYNGEPGDFTAEVAAVGETCTIWRDTANRDQLTDAQAQAFADTIDKQIHDQLQNAFGSWDNVDVDNDGKTAFVFYPMSYAGFFYAADLLPAGTEYATGNAMDMLNMSSSSSASTEVMMSTLAHELQHLINYAQTGDNSDSWLNETFSQSAIAIAGLANATTVYEVPTLIRWANTNGSTYPFIFKNWYVPSGSNSSVPYGSWYLFGRYLAHQTSSYEGGGDAIYKTILNANSEAEGHNSSTIADLEKALQDMGYMGEGKTVADMNALITNYNLALYLRETSGVYSLNGGADSNVNNVDGVEVGRIFAIRSALKELPGGGAASFSMSPSDVTTPKDYGGNIRFAGITTEVLSGVTATPNGEEYTIYGTAVTLSTNDKNARIYYTTDGSNPVTKGREYTAPIVLNQSADIRACTVNADGSNYSPTSSWSYTVVPAPVKASVASGWVQKGTEIALSCDTQDAQIRYTTDGTDPSADNGSVYSAPIKIEETTTLKVMSLLPDAEGVQPGNVYTYTYETGEGEGDRYEPNDSVTAATAVSFPGRLEATLHNSGDVDVYAFELGNSANLNLTLTPPDGTSYSLTLCDGTGNTLAQSAIKGKSQSIRYAAAPGRYLLKVASLEDSFSQTQPYTLSLTKELDKDAVSSLDLSEMNMLTAMSDKSSTGSGYAWDLGPDGGGHFLMSMAYLSHWSGPVTEAAHPYSDQGPYNYKDKSDEAQYHVQNALYLPNSDRANAVDNLKNAVYSYGAADIYIQSASAYWTPNSQNLYVDSSYAYPIEKADGGHIVTVAGWDDDYSRENFTGNPAAARAAGYTDVTIPMPEHDGAFIVKNSWGDQAGDEGYFYLSYEDAYCMMNNPTVFMADELPDNYNRQYMNDPWGTVSFINSSAAFTTTEVFKGAGSGDELLKAVSFVTGDANTRYEISVTQNGVTQKVAEGVKKYAGFYTEALNQAIRIPQGGSFAVNVRLEAQEPGGNASMGIASNVQNATSGIEPAEGVSFISQNGQTVDYGAQSVFFNIRAYTCDVNSSSYKESVSTATTAKGVLPEDTEMVDSLPEVRINDIRLGGQDTASVNGALTASLDGANGAQTPVQSLPAKFDLRETGTLTPVRNQGNLGSCWTFAATACVENNIARNGGFAVDHPTGLSLSDSEKALLLTADAPEQSLSLKASLLGSESPASARINWSVSGDVDSVRLDNTVSMNGETVPVLTALKPGVVTVTAASDADMTVTASCVVTITSQGVESMTLSPDKMTLTKGETGQLSAETSPADAVDKTILWQSDHPEIASVDENGLVTAISGGKAVITAKAGTAVATAEVTVKGAPAVNPGSDSPKTGVMADSTLSAAVCAGLLALCLAGSVLAGRRKEG